MDQVGPGRTKSAQAPAECDKRRDKLPFAELNLCLRCMLSEREGQESRGGFDIRGIGGKRKVPTWGRLFVSLFNVLSKGGRIKEAGVTWIDVRHVGLSM
jgi:hypothetical protein